MQYIPIYKENIPYEAQYNIGGTTYHFNFRYNAMGDFFTVDLHLRGEAVILGEKVIFGKALFSTYRADDRFPKQPIIPVDVSLNKDRAGWPEMGEDVYLYLPEVEHG